MRRRNVLKLIALIVAVGAPYFFTQPVFAADGVAQVHSFIESVIKLLAGLAGLVATVFFVIGGFIYITSSGNPEKLEGAKRTLFYSALGLAITTGAFVISTIVTNLATSAFGS